MISPNSQEMSGAIGFWMTIDERGHFSSGGENREVVGSKEGADNNSDDCKTLGSSCFLH